MVGEGMCGGGCAWQGEGHAWQGGTHGRGHVWQGWHAWQGLRGGGACMVDIILDTCL